MTISLIVAVAENDVIGKRGVILPWRLPADLAHFKQVTMGHPIIMGRKTYQTINRPLPGRHNIIITRNPGLQAEGCSVVSSLDNALELARADQADEVFIIGGATMYEQALPIADRIYMTQVHAKPEGDVYFRFNQDEWRNLTREDHEADDKNEYPYSFLTLERAS